jgi:N-acetylglucosaminyldiphosphoundecaprenol N-acetyl-beta-D-mannosaminyltransferase
MLVTQRLFDLDFVADGDVGSLVELLLEEDRDPPRGWRCTVTPNVDHLVRYQRNPLEAGVARRATVVLPDGMPIVWASRLLGRPLRSRLTGSDLFGVLWPRLAAASVPAVVVASGPDVATGLAAEHPGARVIVAPRFDVADEAAVASLVDRVVAETDEVGARFVVVGISMPKHHLIAHHLEQRWNGREAAPMVLLLGAAPNFHLGFTARAPGWMQRFGLEWLHRLAGDPGRLARRYLVDDPRFVGILWREWRSTRRGEVRARG